MNLEQKIARANKLLNNYRKSLDALIQNNKQQALELQKTKQKINQTNQLLRAYENII